jgi:hypothetical protein
MGAERVRSGTLLGVSRISGYYQEHRESRYTYNIRSATVVTSPETSWFHNNFRCATPYRYPYGYVLSQSSKDIGIRLRSPSA